MGVQLWTDAGPVTVTWTSRFFPYGVEVFLEPIEHHLDQHEEGPTRNGPDPTAQWARRLGTPIRSTQIWWDQMELDPGTRSDGTIVSPARSVELPTAIRLDFDAGAVWLVAAIPQRPGMDHIFRPGDEIMVVFSTTRMHRMGYTDPRFTKSRTRQS
jgi:hypothetical protein